MPVPNSMHDYLRMFAGELGERILQSLPALHNAHDPVSPRLAPPLGIHVVHRLPALRSTLPYEGRGLPAIPFRNLGMRAALGNVGKTGEIDPLPFVLHSIDFHHPYLAERGISAETAKHFGIGFFPRRGCMAGRIVIPIHNEEGLLVAYAGRTLGQAEPKYRFPSRFRESLVLFNLHRAICCGDTVVVVEGFFDCLNVHQAGLPCVVALMGCALSRRQELLLESHFRNVVLLMDGDKAGRNAGAEIAGRLVAKLSTRLVEVPTGSQPDQLCADQIRCLCIPGYF